MRSAVEKCGAPWTQLDKNNFLKQGVLTLFILCIKFILCRVYFRHPERLFPPELGHYNWFRHYLLDFFIIYRIINEPTKLRCGVPQGFILSYFFSFDIFLRGSDCDGSVPLLPNISWQYNGMFVCYIISTVHNNQWLWNVSEWMGQNSLQLD